MSPDLLVRLDGIQLSYQGRELLREVDMQIEPGEIVTLIGPNGCGKTSLVKLALGLQRPTAGTVFTKPGIRVGYVPQKLDLDSSMPINADRFAMLAHQEVTDERLQDAFQRTGLTNATQSPVHTLSGGEMRRLLFARALIRRPHLLVLDEPTAGIDVSGQAEMYRLISEARDQTGCGVLVVSHDLHLVMAATDQVICINGHVCCSGSPEHVSRHPEYLSLFGDELAGDVAVYTHHHDHHHRPDGAVTQ